MTVPRALWLEAPRRPVLRDAAIAPERGDAVVATLYSGISRGTESLVFAGRVPPSEYERMRAPLQQGDFPFPVKYGYSAVGRVEEGPAELRGRAVFALHPHQTRFACPAEMAIPLPEGVPAARAVLAPTMETALNIVWDGALAPGDRVCVIGAGAVGALAAWLAARIPGTEVTLVDVNPSRAALAAALGCAFARPEGAPPGRADAVIHASASAAGLETALSCAGREATVVEASWYGAGAVPAPLGGAFHSQRLRLVSSQVSSLPPARAVRWSHRRRLAKALELLADPALDALITGQSGFDELPSRYGAILDDPETLCHRVHYAPARGDSECSP
ncbi:dehydrogenase [Rhodobacteraceae bacterium WD3A24]|nr:dehydrogenase [Rhodobacteraceae bacterium WD3A24]